MEYGLQMYSVRDVTENDMEGTLREVAAMGYSMVEFAGFMGHSAERIAEWLQKYSLKASGTHTGLDALTDDVLADTISYHKAIGCKNIIIPWADLSSKAKADAVVDRINELIPILKTEGIDLHYHNHTEEFERNADGLIPLEELIARTDVKLEVDTYWVFAAGKDPAAYIREHCDRISVIHLKDGLDGGHEGKSLGLGDVPIKEILETAAELGLEIVVESEDLNPTGLEEVKRCIDYLKA